MTLMLGCYEHTFGFEPARGRFLHADGLAATCDSGVPCEWQRSTSTTLGAHRGDDAGSVPWSHSSTATGMEAGALSGGQLRTLRNGSSESSYPWTTMDHTGWISVQPWSLSVTYGPVTVTRCPTPGI